MPPPIRSSTTSSKAGFVFEDTLEATAADKVVDDFLKGRLRVWRHTGGSRRRWGRRRLPERQASCLKTRWKPPPIRSSTTSSRAGFVFEDTLEAAAANEVVNNNLFRKIPFLKTLWKLPFFTSTRCRVFYRLAIFLLVNVNQGKTTKVPWITVCPFKSVKTTKKSPQKASQQLPILTHLSETTIFTYSFVIL